MHLLGELEHDIKLLAKILFRNFHAPLHNMHSTLRIENICGRTGEEEKKEGDIANDFPGTSARGARA